MIKIFVHLAENKDASRWLELKQAGQLVGVNDETPYGYGRANQMGCDVTFSRSHNEAWLEKLLRLGLRLILGFDFVHAWRQRSCFQHADVVWTHTESQFLAVAAVLRVGGSGRRPCLLGQSVWLFDNWHAMSVMRRWFYRWLINRVDILTFHSVQNLSIAKEQFPNKRVERISFGIPSERMRPPRQRAMHPIRILGIGNDRDRDWSTLVAAIGLEKRAYLTILSETAHRSLARDFANVQILKAETNQQLEDAFEEATVVCVPLKPNKHASGITVILEAVLAGVPVIATDTGGLIDYFGGDEVCYIPDGDVTGWRKAVLNLGSDPSAACAMALRAQKRLLSARLTADAFIRRHVDLSAELFR